MTNTRERIPYAEAGTRFRMSRERLAASERVVGLGGQGKKRRQLILSTSSLSWRLWAVCMEMTTSYSKSSDRIHLTTLARKAGISVDKASILMRAFHEEGIVIWIKERRSRSTGFLALPGAIPASGELPDPERPASGDPSAPLAAFFREGEENDPLTPSSGWTCSKRGCSNPAPWDGAWCPSCKEGWVSPDVPSGTHHSLADVEARFGEGPSSAETDKERTHG